MLCFSCCYSCQEGCSCTWWITACWPSTWYSTYRSQEEVFQVEGTTPFCCPGCPTEGARTAWSSCWWGPTPYTSSPCGSSSCSYTSSRPPEADTSFFWFQVTIYFVFIVFFFGVLHFILLFYIFAFFFHLLLFVCSQLKTYTFSTSSRRKATPPRRKMLRDGKPVLALFGEKKRDNKGNGRGGPPTCT